MHPIAIILSPLTIISIFYIKPVQAERCTKVIQREGSEFIVNTCNACRKVNIRRKRRGVAMPVMRTYNIQARSKFPTSFKGRGRSRITSEVPCKGADDAGVNIFEQQTPPQIPNKCVTLTLVDGKGVVLINRCSRCRTVAVQRYANTGRPLGQQVYKVQSLSVVSVQPKGAAQVRGLAELPCKS